MEKQTDYTTSANEYYVLRGADVPALAFRTEKRDSSVGREFDARSRNELAVERTSRGLLSAGSSTKPKTASYSRGIFECGREQRTSVERARGRIPAGVAVKAVGGAPAQRSCRVVVAPPRDIRYRPIGNGGPDSSIRHAAAH